MGNNDVSHQCRRCERFPKKGENYSDWERLSIVGRICPKCSLGERKARATLLAQMEDGFPGVVGAAVYGRKKEKKS